MITKLSHITIFVKDQEKAKDFYVGKLGFEVRTDAKMDSGFRWLTVGPKEQPDLEIVLVEPKPGPMFNEATAAQVQKLLDQESMGGGVFETEDCKATYEELKARGVEFTSPPKEQFYGIEALFKDGLGNWYSMTERKK
ncbi:MAG TPA: VOC family protein [Acidobacteriota bacterium]|nr:VOC family protein [Acidobacteriota bacterium]